jgi:hypothetical protein
VADNIRNAGGHGLHSTGGGSMPGVINVPICAGLNGGRGAADGQPK